MFVFLFPVGIFFVHTCLVGCKFQLHPGKFTRSISVGLTLVKDSRFNILWRKKERRIVATEGVLGRMWVRGRRSGRGVFIF